MDRYQHGDFDALAELAISLLPKLEMMARRRFSDQSLAIEATQEFWIKIMKNAKSFKHDSKVQTWAIQIVNNAYLDLIRKERRSKIEFDELSAVENDASFSSEFTEGSVNEITIRSALRSIPKDQAAALSLVLMDQFSVEEAAKILGVPAGTVKSRISRGKDALKVKLQEKNGLPGNQKHV
jgi:RNA polymerase sigma-70 factor (ECF subfamily)